MPFNDIADIMASRSNYVDKVKVEFKARLKDRQIADFWYYDGLPPGDATGQIFVFGKMQATDLKKLKDASKAHALGECMLDGKTLRIRLTKGKIQLPHFNKAMKEIGSNYSAELVDSFGANPVLTGIAADTTVDPIIAQVTALLDRASEAMNEIKPKLGKEDAQNLLMLLTPLVNQASAKAPDLAKAMQANSAFEKRLAELKSSLGEEKNAPPSKAEVELGIKWDAVMSRFDRVKALITDSERLTLRKLWALADKQKETGKFEEALKTLAGLDKTLMSYAKQALADQKTSADDAEKRLQAGKVPESDEAKKVGALVVKKLEWVKSAEAMLKKEQAALEKLRFGILKVKDAPTAARLKAENEGLDDPNLVVDQTLLDKLEKEFEAAQTRIAAARDQVGKQQAQLSHLQSEYEKKASKPDSRLSQIFAAANSQISRLESLLEEIPVDEARKALEATVKEMAEATAWREERIKAEATGTAGHATGRHGAQTGLERQARRAATSESYLDTSGSTAKVKTRGGVTPDQPGNAAGTAQQTTSWNGIDITWAELDGKRVIAERAVTVKSLMSGPTSTGGSLVGSLWGTPVLEKRAFDAVTDVATKLRAYTQYQKANGSWGDFKQLNVSLGPTKSGGAGWGYAVKKTGKKGTALTEPQANAVLDSFEKGSITLDELFKQMSVAMVADENGKNMVQGVTAIFRRQNVTDAFRMVTQYPNGDISADGWKPFDQAAGTMKFRDSSNVETSLTLSTLP